MLVMGTPNRVRERREELRMSQAELAHAVSLSRQSVSAIETERATPSVAVALSLATALDSSVEDLFADGDVDRVFRAEPAWEPVAGRVALAEIGGRWVCYPLARSGMRLCADGVGGRIAPGQVKGRALRSNAEAQENVALLGCAAALGLLADRLNSRPGRGRFLWLGGSSTRALRALARRHTLVAGVHLVDPRTGEANVTDVRRHVGAEPVVLVTLARWEVGLVIARGNPKCLSGIADLGRRGVRLVTREEGSGARRLLERELERAGLSRDLAKRAPVRAIGHLEVAHAVSLGAADLGVATRDAAIAFGLGFVPLAEERYDLAMPVPGLEDARLLRLLDVMTSGEFRRELACLGYDASASGDRVAEIHAA